MIWAFISRSLSVAVTLAGVSLLSPVLVPLARALVKPLVGPMTNLYLDIAEEIGEVMEERENRKARQALVKEKVLSKKDEEIKEIEEGTAVLDEVGKLL